MGSDAEMLALAGPDSQVVDLRGRAVLPGFVEPHAHPYWEGLVAGMALLAGRERRAALRAVPGAGEHLEPGRLARRPLRPDGLGPPRRPDPRRPRPRRPRSARSSWPTSRGMPSPPTAWPSRWRASARRTPDAPGRLAIERDAAGEPTGILRGPDAWDRIAAAMPPPTAAEGRAALARAAARLAADGVTSVADADLGSTAGVAAELAAWGAAIEDGAMPLAVALLPGLVRIAAAPDDAVPSPGRRRRGSCPRRSATGSA